MLGSGLLVASALHCSIPDLPSDGGTCPCAPGWSCDKPTNQCVHGEVASSSSSSGGSTSNGGGSTTTTGLGGAGGAGGAGGGGGVGACGGAGEWQPGATDWANYMCTDASPNCSLNGDQVLCCDNVNPIDAHTSPSTVSPSAGTLTSAHSWFVCWLRAEEVAGNSIWYYTSPDDGAAWGWVSGSELQPGGSPFDPANPVGLAQCPCL